jgi:hypothetical protein
MANPKGNPQNFNPIKPKNKMAFDGGIYLKLYLNKEKALKSIPNWTDKLREAIDRLIESELGSAD